MSSRRWKLQKRVWGEEKFCQEMRTVVCSMQTWSHKGGSFIAWYWMQATQLFCGYFDQCGFSLAIYSWPKSFLSSRNSLFTGPCEYWAKFLAPSIFGQKTTPCKKTAKENIFQTLKQSLFLSLTRQRSSDKNVQTSNQIILIPSYPLDF